MKKPSDIIARTVHWGFALFVLSMLAIGFYMTNSPFDLPTYQLHKSLGVIFLALVSFRIYSRIRHPWRSSATGTRSEGLVRTVHFVLLMLLVAMPITGAVSSGFSGYSLHLFDWIIVPENHTASGEIVPFNAAVYDMAKRLHRYFAYTLAGLVSLHILAALKHHFIDKDATLKRMLLGQSSKR